MLICYQYYSGFVGLSTEGRTCLTNNNEMNQMCDPYALLRGNKLTESKPHLISLVLDAQRMNPVTREQLARCSVQLNKSNHY